MKTAADRRVSIKERSSICNSEYVIGAVIDKLMGRSAFKGKSPVDPFCGKWDLRF